MKSGIIPMIACAAILSSCSGIYKSGQTPDDVYFSPTRESASYVEVKKDAEEDDRYRSNNNYTDVDDQWLRMRVRNPYRWSTFDNYYYGNDWAYGGGMYYNSYSPWSLYTGFNSYWNWNNYYNPYCRNVVVVNPKTNPAAYSTVRNFSLNSYTNNNYSNNNRPRGYIKGGTGSTYNNANSGSLGTSIRKIFSGSGSNSNGYSNGNVYSPSSGERPSRSYSPSSSSSNSGGSSGRSSGGSSSGSSGGGVSRPSRGGN